MALLVLLLRDDSFEMSLSFVFPAQLTKGVCQPFVIRCIVYFSTFGFGGFAGLLESVVRLAREGSAKMLEAPTLKPPQPRLTRSFLGGILDETGCFLEISNLGKIRCLSTNGYGGVRLELNNTLVLLAG